MSRNKAQNIVQTIYANELEGTRPSFKEGKEGAIAYYADFVDFVSRIAPADHKLKATHLLDVGCGSGWSSFAFVQAGYKATGVDLNMAIIEPPPTKGLTFLQASVTDLQFTDRSFDIVAAYQCIEHVPDPEAALKEMIRVCKPGGIICI